MVKLSKTLAPGTVRQTFQHLRTMMRSAVADGIITVDPTMKIKLPTVSSELTIPDSAQVRALVEAASPMFSTAVMLGAHVGLRAGEVQDLFVSDVDFLRRTVNVRRQLDGRSTAMTLGELRTGCGLARGQTPAEQGKEACFSS